MGERRPSVVIVGGSTRAFAESAARAGYKVWAVDAFGDRDLQAIATTLILTKRRGIAYTPAAAADIARLVPAAGVAYVSALENHAGAVERMVDGRRLWGNPPAVLRRVRDPEAMARLLAQRGIDVPAIRGGAPRAPRTGRWMIKPRASGGGQDVALWRPGAPVGPARYLQERIDGVAGSVSFVADGRRAVLLGISRQLVGERTFGVAGFRYCGSLLAAGGAPLFGAADAALARAALRLASAATDAFGLVGLNGIDFIARAGVPIPIEINPRYCASMELAERALDQPLFALHVRACGGRLPRMSNRAGARQVFGKAIVFARRAVRVGDTDRWLADPDVRDVPHAGDRIARGRPVCTVLAAAPTAARCHRLLRRRAAAVYRALAPAGARR